MSTPTRNTSSYASPYAQEIQQYPSQSADFLSLEVGGPKQTPQRQQQYRQHGRGRYNHTPGRRNFNAESGGDDEQGGQPAGAAIPYFYQNTAAAARQNERNERNDRRGSRNFNSRFNKDNNGQFFFGGKKNFHGFNRQQHQHRDSHGNGGYDANDSRSGQKPQDTYALYYHPSMVEDPWQELVARRQRLRASVISEPKSDDSPDAFVNYNDSDDSENENPENQ